MEVVTPWGRQPLTSQETTPPTSPGALLLQFPSQCFISSSGGALPSQQNIIAESSTAAPTLSGRSAPHILLLSSCSRAVPLPALVLLGGCGGGSECQSSVYWFQDPCSLTAAPTVNNPLPATLQSLVPVTVGSVLRRAVIPSPGPTLPGGYSCSVPQLIPALSGNLHRGPWRGLNKPLRLFSGP